MKNYATYDNNNFFIRKNSTLPELEFHINKWLRERYNLTDEMFDNVAVTFSMIDVDTGRYAIANVPAKLEITLTRPEYQDVRNYKLVYKFKLHETRLPGRYYGEFKLDFLGDTGCGKLTLPTEEKINIIISDSITKTTVV